MLAEALDLVLAAAPDERPGMPITFVVDDAGVRQTISRYGDDIIDFGPHMRNPATQSSKVNLQTLPSAWRESVLDLIVTFWRFGRPGEAAPEPSTVISAFVALKGYVTWLDQLGVKCFSIIRPIHVQAYAKHLREAPIESRSRHGQRRTPEGVRLALAAVSLPWDLRARIHDAMGFAPFEYGDIGRLSSHAKRGPRRPKTRAMTDEEAIALFATCESCLATVESDIALAEEMERWRVENPMSCGYSAYQSRKRRFVASHGFVLEGLGRRLTLAKAAALCEIGLLVGPRISELLSLKLGCYYETERDGQNLGWVKGVTLKMRKRGAESAEWLAPPRVGELVQLLERITRPLRAQLREELGHLEAKVAGLDASSPNYARMVLKLKDARQQSDLLLLSDVRNLGRDGHDFVRGPGRKAADLWFRDLGKMAGLSFRLTPHMLRRTFAVTVVHQCAGDLRYLKKHFQHWSIETTQLYATHDKREQDLVDEVGDELLQHKSDIVLSWLDPATRLGGEGGRHIAAQRQKPEFSGHMGSSLIEVARAMADTVVMRPNGHSMCISSGMPTCGGQGLYDATFCADCDGAVVTEAQIPIWKQLTRQMLEVDLLSDCGPGGSQVAKRSLASFAKVIEPFGITIDSMRAEVATEIKGGKEVTRRDARVQEIRLAIRRVETGRVKKVKVGTKLSISSVAAEAGIDPSTIHTRYPDLAESIREKTGKASRADRNRKAEQLRAMRLRFREERAERETLKADIASVTSRLHTALAELQVFKEAAGSGGRVVPVGSRPVG